jgi:hypothetical protein
MTDDEFKRHLYKQLAEDEKNKGILTNRIYSKSQFSKAKPKPKTK